VRESPIEQYFCEQVRKNGGKAYKWVSPGEPGVPDRLVLWMHTHRIDFAELKATWGSLESTQIIQFKRIKEKFGHFVFVFSSKHEIDLYIAGIRKERLG
jgi:hypothetical protein